MGLQDLVFRAFGKPSGPLGYFAGRIMSARGSNVERNRWGVDLLELEGHRVLEFGCGPGLALDFILPRAGTVVALDHSARMIEMAGRRHRKEVESRQLQLFVDDILDFASSHPEVAKFDRIYSSNVVQFWPDLLTGVRAVQALLRPGGRVVTNYMSRGKSPSTEKTHLMAERIARAHQDAGYSSVRIEYLDLKPIGVASVVAES